MSDADRILAWAESRGQPLTDWQREVLYRYCEGGTVAKPLTRCLHNDPTRGRCIMAPHQTSTHVYDRAPDAGALGRMNEHGLYWAPPEADLPDARSWPDGWIPLGVAPETDEQPVPLTRDYIARIFGVPARLLRDDPDDDRPLSSLWTVVAWCTAAGVALGVVTAIVWRYDRRRQR